MLSWIALLFLAFEIFLSPNSLPEIKAPLSSGDFSEENITSKHYLLQLFL